MTNTPQELGHILALNQHLAQIRQEHGGLLTNSEGIASNLNQKEFYTFRGRKWNSATIRKYLSSKAYNENIRKKNGQYND
jgi:hypothetical protein